LALCGPRRGLPWFIGNQIKMIVPRQGSRAPYMPSPDILVHPTLTNTSRTSLILATDGPPALVIEVASPSTAWSSDLNLADPRGKPGAYEAIGIPEYIVFDPTAELLGDQLWARRLGPDGYEPWEPTTEGRWISRALGGIAFVPQGVLLRIYDQNGKLVPTSEEMADLLDEREQRLAESERQIAALEAALRRQSAE
ncbi:MAG TPA: Uma2 family endonuclease, partial [Thermomicrobiales bacterium]|jgi:Uma2 family endonuclease